MPASCRSPASACETAVRLRGDALTVPRLREQHRAGERAGRQRGMAYSSLSNVRLRLWYAIYSSNSTTNHIPEEYIHAISRCTLPPTESEHCAEALHPHSVLCPARETSTALSSALRARFYDIRGSPISRLYTLEARVLWVDSAR